MSDSTSPWPLAGARPGEVVVIARWTPSPEGRAQVDAALPGLVGASLAEPGCLGYRAYRPDGDADGDIVLVERYADRDALEAHRTSAHFREIAVERIVPLLADREVVVTTVG
ncbi:putative quinol monooxygenase [Streptomyces sp. NPDC001380]|uniref:putative quinol monooxygenase n=1 Tax=Streptomyces sp. NPDC001380 TaxID=3364566 RepID=UPI0036737E8E